jgi:DNA-binding NtrC family response regulator
LENILERAINLSEGSTILSKNLTINIKEQDNFNGDRIVPLRDIVKYYEKKSIENALKYFNGDKKKAMNALDVSKTTFYEKLRKYSIN